MLTIMLPPALAMGGEGQVRRIYAAVGDRLAGNARLLDFAVDLGAGSAHDCPPIMHYRLLVREGGWLRRLTVGEGTTLTPGVPLALLGNDPDEPLDALSARAARVTVASILFHAEGWGGLG